MNAIARRVLSTAVLLAIAVLLMLTLRRGSSVPSQVAQTNSPAPGMTVDSMPVPSTPHEARPSSGEIVGIGIVLSREQNSQKLMVRSVITGSPADKAGLTEGLVVHTIDGVSTGGLNLKDCVERIRGPAGSVVQLGLLDPDGGETNTVEITREKIQVRL